MRELKQETAKTVAHLSPPIYSKEPEIFSDGSEKSYSSSNASEANAPVIIIVMFSFAVSIPLLVLALRCFLCGGGETDQNRISQARRDTEQEKLGIGRPVSLFLLAPTFKYSAELDLAGSERECIICLSEFVDGEEVKVLTRCKHGFHVRCIDQWFSSHLSCPLCRSRVRFSSMVEREEDFGNRASNSQAAFVRPENETVDSSAA